MNKLLTVGIVILAGYFAAMVYVINVGLHDIRVNSFRLGCMYANTSYEAIGQCKESAEFIVGK